MRGMTERRQHRFFLTSQAVDLLYTTDHQHPGPREEARTSSLAAFHPEGELPADFRERFALDHEHPPHLEGPGDSPFTAGGETGESGEAHDHEHPPWTATSRGVETSLRRLAMLEPVYRLAPDLLRSGRVNWPAADTAVSTTPWPATAKTSGPTLPPPFTEGGGDLVRVPPPDEMTPGLDREDQGMALLAARFAALGQTVCDPMMQ